jgi:hypothetical protein
VGDGSEGVSFVDIFDEIALIGVQEGVHQASSSTLKY